MRERKRLIGINQSTIVFFFFSFDENYGLSRARSWSWIDASTALDRKGDLFLRCGVVGWTGKDEDAR